jgi:hypothetical protein
LRDVLFRLLQGERSLLEHVKYGFLNPPRIIGSSAADEPAPHEDKKA